MTIRSKSLTAIALIGLLLTPSTALAQGDSASKSYVKVLSDHPGAATALTPRQKAEITELVAKAKGNKTMICTAASLAGQRASMYPLVRLRAQLVCDYAKSLNPDLKTTVQERTTAARQFNGRVVVVSR